MTGYVLDANALYRFLVGGEDAERVAELFEQASDSNQNLSMSVVNWGEVYYTIMRGAGRDIANRTMAQVQGLPLRVWDADELLTRQAADLRASYGLPYADCFAAALAGKENVIVTSDVKDFKLVPWIQILPLKN